MGILQKPVSVQSRMSELFLASVSRASNARAPNLREERDGSHRHDDARNNGSRAGAAVDGSAPAVFGLMLATDVAQRRDGTVNRFAFSLADRQARPRARPDRSGVRSGDVDIDASRGLWARVFTPAAAASSPPLPVVVYFHGGGFALFTAASAPLDAMCARLCREVGAVVVSVNYRLAPEHRCPAAYDDGVDVLRFLPAGLAVPVDLARCFLAGDSAGGNIAHHVAQRWTSAASSSSPVRLAGVVLIQPFFGGEERTESERPLKGVAPVVNARRSDWSWRAFLPPGADRNHPAAHVTGAGARAAGRVPAGDGGGRRVRPAAGLAAAVRRDAKAEGEGGARRGVPGGHPRVLRVPRAR
jgi:acetyl esterase/lipase